MAETLFAHARQTLAYFKTPGWIAFLDKLPTTGTQKIQKGQIFQAGTDARQHPAAHDLRTLKRRGSSS
jgi:crotonobetaine/carnitine-CoA ligase